MLLYIIAPIALFINGIITGILAYSLAGKKGYDGYFWTGFFFGYAGLIYVGFLPSKQTEEKREWPIVAAKAAQAEMVRVPAPTTEKTDDSVLPEPGSAPRFIVCPNCKTEQPRANDVCYFCKAKFKPTFRDEN